VIARQPGSRNAKVPMPEPAEEQAGTMRPRSKQGSVRPLLREGFIVSGVLRGLHGPEPLVGEENSGGQEEAR
jgi:hypothetical protein